MAKVKGQEHYWFKFDIGAYESGTDHLTMLQDGAYNRLIRHYYKTYKPIPLDQQQIVRISRAHSAEEIEAVSSILDQFFTQKVDGWHNKRADMEILSAKGISKSRQDSAQRRWSDRRDAKAYASASASEVQLDTQLQLQKHIEPKIKSIVHFVHPSIQEVTAYCQQRANRIDPQQWMDHYSANGWKVGRNSMKDWRAAVRTWEKNGHGTNGLDHQKQSTPSKAVSRWHSNSAELGDSSRDDLMVALAQAAGADQTSRLSAGSPRVLEGEIKKLH